LTSFGGESSPFSDFLFISRAPISGCVESEQVLSPSFWMSSSTYVESTATTS
jgi:hypothetical protein